jgi:uncharacterized repeat protein (TIGR02543 family)
MQRRRIHFHLSLLALTLIFAVALGLSSCGGGVKFNLNFVVDEEVYSTVSTNGNEAIELPANPTKKGYTFDGWYWDNGTWQKPFTANSLINAPLSSDMSVYAKFNYNDFLTPNLQGTDISSNEMSVLNDRISYVVSNTTEMFSFLNDITVANEASYIVARDLACQDVIVSKTASLEYGDNVFYIFVTYGNDSKLYTVTIRRLPVYTVSFNTEGGTDVATQRIEEGSFAIVPTTDRAGYTFISWSYDLATPITDNITLTSRYEEVVAPYITYSPNTWTNDKTTVTISSDHDDYTYMYKIGDGDYQEYTGPFDISENTTVYAYSVKNTIASLETSVSIDNIDKMEAAIRPPSKYIRSIVMLYLYRHVRATRYKYFSFYCLAWQK